MNLKMLCCVTAFCLGVPAAWGDAGIHEEYRLVNISSYGEACRLIRDWTGKMVEEGKIPSNKAANLEQALGMLEKGADVKGPEGRCALMVAAALGRKEMVEFLFSMGALPGGGEGWNTLLREAVLGRNTSIAASVLQRGAAVNHTDREGDSVLMLAARENDGPMVKLLLEYGADAAAVNHNGESAADGAGRSGHAELEATLRSAMKAVQSGKIKTASSSGMKPCLEKQDV